ncbi:hypothetical protein FA13DRAFT_1788315 [Coprinellus micaceus]|uniref:DUF7704 domain-containing protein n=1 Tax=Coprinellus micaceus TaxID=71717 RepID=A0A4Y7TNB6_COPMI|nr:hypothetical protein FA13DRAFT_1788315 [Coprinellus micaceus]
MPPSSPIPDLYFFCFAVYEPFLTIIGFLGACADPTTTHNAQAPWPPGMKPYDVLPRPTLVTTLQLAHVCALLGIVNAFVLTAVRKHLRGSPALQEKIVFALLTPLLLGDVFHLYVTFWALGEQRWAFWEWSPMLWTTVLLGFTLMIPRIAWHLGVGRYVDHRDGQYPKSHSLPSPQDRPKNPVSPTITES